MIIGVPKEIKPDENRVALTPAGAEILVRAGHQVLLEKGAGRGSGFADEDYLGAGGVVLPGAAEVYAAAEMILKVKEPLPPEYSLLRQEQILFTYLHLAPAPDLARVLLERKVVAIAYETIQLSDGSLPLLVPMSEIAGRMAVQIGAQYLEKPYGGRGILLGGVPGVPPADVVIIGGGVVGTSAAKVALGMGAQVYLLDRSLERLRYLDDLFQGRVITMMSNAYNLERVVAYADLLIGAVLVPGARAPRLVTEAMVKKMKPGSVIVDVAVDQGGSVETVDRVTTHSQPTYEKHGVIHYAVANMPGAVPRTSTFALTNATLPYIQQIAAKGYAKAAIENEALAHGFNLVRGHVTHRAVAEALGLPYRPLMEVLKEKEIPGP